MKKSLAELRLNLNCGKNGCVDLTVPRDILLSEVSVFRLLLSGVLEEVFKESGNKVAAYLIRMPESDVNPTKALSNFVQIVRFMRTQSTLPFILDATHCPDEDLLWVRMMLHDSIITVCKSDQKVQEFCGSIYLFTPKKSIPELPLIKEDLEKVRNILGEETIILVSEVNKEIEQADYGKGVIFQTNHPFMLSFQEFEKDITGPIGFFPFRTRAS